jgi:hypothetical protein
MIIRIYLKGGENKNSRGRRELTLTIIILLHNKNFRWTCPTRGRNDKNSARTR